MTWQDKPPGQPVLIPAAIRVRIHRHLAARLMRLAAVVAALVFVGLMFMCSPARADPAKASLTIETESQEVWFNVNVADVRVPAATKLADSAGEHAVPVVITGQACPSKDHAESREIGLTGSTWCVHVSGLKVGYAVSGTIATPATTLLLTVKRKASVEWPVAWSVIALLCAVIISLLSSTVVPNLTSRLRLLYSERDHGITGLGAWVKKAAAEGLMSNDDIAARAEWARKFGKKQVEAVRRRLRAAQKSGQDLEGCPLWQACTEEAARKDVKRDDVLTDDGARSTTAANMLDALTKASTAISAFESSAAALIAKLKGSEKQLAQQECDGAVRLAKTVTESDVPQFVGQLSAALEAIQSSAPTPVPALAPHGAGQFISFPTMGRSLRATVANMDISAKEIFVPVAVYIPGVLLAVVVMAGAIAAVFSAQYLANPNFGTISDYWSLILSSYGSAQATAIAAALLLARSPKPWYG